MDSRPLATFETISCPACDSSEFTSEFSVRDRFDTLPGQLFHIVRCRRCRLLYLNPRPDENSIAAFYASSDYDPFISSRGGQGVFDKLYRNARRLSVMRKASRVSEGIAAGAKTLDVGCATGEFMLELRRRGFQPFGVEPDGGAASFARDRHKLQVWTGMIEAIPSSSGPYDLITFWHVLEHVHRLRQTLDIARSLLSERGRLAIAVPNPQSLDARFYGTRWVAWDTPRHLYHFEPPVMLELLENSGFRAERAGAVAFDAFYHTLLSERKSLTGYVRGGWCGAISYARGLIGADGSSELYFAYKKS